MTKMLIRDVMSKPVIAAREAMPFKEIVRVMSERRISALPVLDAEDRLIGIISEADLLPKQRETTARRWWSPQSPSSRRSDRKSIGDTAGHLMSRSVVVVDEDASIGRAARIMDAESLKRLPVVDSDRKVIGMVSRVDLLGAFLRSDEEICEEVIGEIFIQLLWADPERFDVSVRDGIVTLTGELQQRSHVPVAIRLVRQVDGVIDVVADLGYEIDDTIHPRH